MKKAGAAGFKMSVLAFSVVILALCFVVALGSGSVNISFANVVKALFGQNPDPVEISIVTNVRLPRVLIAIFVGMSLSASGCLLQAVLRNPIADPGIIGVSSGASFMTILIMLVIPGLSKLIPIISFMGAVVACVIINILAYTKGELSPGRLVLAGVAINSFFGAGTSIISVLHSDEVGPVIMWLNGSLTGRSWQDAKLLIPYVIVGLLLSLLCIKVANVLQLGEETAKNLGINLLVSRLMLIFTGAYLAAITVSFVGIIGFVGLVIPHISRMLVSSDHRFMLPLSIILGGVLVLAADTCARTLFLPTELPVGSLIALVGGPFFVYLLRKSQRAAK